MESIEKKIDFNEKQIQDIFGHEAAENENSERLRQYYFKSSVFDQVDTDLSLRVLVGHKGIGKSALFQVAMAEQRDKGELTVLIKPDDIVSLGVDTSDFLRTIREWKIGLTAIITREVLCKLGIDGSGILDKAKGYSGRIIDFLQDTFLDIPGVNFSPTKKKLIDGFLEKNTIYVYIDDLDRGWQGRAEDNTRISALLNAIRDISTENRGIFFRIALRSDVYFLVRTSDESTDKIEGSVIWHSWNNHEIFVLLIKRIESFFGRSIDEKKLLDTPPRELAKYLNLIMEPRFIGRGHWRDAPMYRVLMSLIRRRPRDLVKLCTLAARKAHERRGELITTKDLEASFEDYSQGRLQDTINEFRSELPSIERLLMGMKPSKKERTAKQGYAYSGDALIKKIKTIQEQGDFRFFDRGVAETKELAAFMYKINFLTARKEKPTEIIRKYFEENRYLNNRFVDFGFEWEVHPAYRWALQPDDIEDVFASLKLSSDTEG
uniref:ATP-binding protein n=1 Tax=Candidatus Kentrum sp. DK TaxID=2126562 RepID=A0A450T3N2_9GAMM|nr:MAG: hypothetical protein BECKDK2373C_GA0170839_10878 [Candidatus Kentron sp. DK]